MTLLELIISMAISAIVIMMLISFINAAFHVFRKTNDEVNLQMEAQTALNQMENLLLEAQNEWSGTGSDGTTRFFIKEISTPDYVLVYNSTQGKLYLAEADATNYLTVVPVERDTLLAEYVTEISIGTESEKIRTISIKLSLGNETYEASKKVSLRNFSPTPTP